MWWTAFRATIRGGIHSTSSISDTTATSRSNLFYRQNKSQDDPGQKMKRKTASERQRNLERLFGTPHRFNRLKKSGFFNSIYWAFRRFHFWLCFYDDHVEVDIEDLLNPFNTQPPSLDDLQKLTGFKRDWITFLYRNFKQICPSGRMSSFQWRQIFRLIFKGATDYEFADRIFLAIAGNRSQKLITFEDLVFCLYDLIQSFRSAQHPALDSNQGSVPSTTTAQFTFSLMKPDQEGVVDEAAFLRYAKCIFDLSSSIGKHCRSGDAATFGMFHAMGSSQSSQQINEKVANSKQLKEQVLPWVDNLAKQQFRALDTNEDGFITLSDIQTLFDHQLVHAYEPLILHQENEYTEARVLLEKENN